MVDEGAPTPTPEPSSVKMPEQTLTESSAQPDETLTSTETAIESTAQESTRNDGDYGETSGPSADGDREKSIEFSDELMERGSTALKDKDYPEAAECFSRALEIRVAHYGELSAECLNAYYQYGRALLYKAQEEADPLGSVPKKESETQQESNDEGSTKNSLNRESSVASVSSNTKQDQSLSHQEGAGGAGKEQEEEDDGSDDEDLAEADEDESDLDLAWKMLDVARAIAEKQAGNTLEKVDILSTLAEVSMEREDIETSLSDYQKALSIVEQLVEPDSRRIAELNFWICLCLEIGSKPQEAIPYCQKAISVCKSRLERLKNEVQSSVVSSTSSGASELDGGRQQSSIATQIDKSVTERETEIESLNGLFGELEKKLEDLQQLALNPKSILSEILGMVSAKAKGGEKSASPAVMTSSQMGTSNSNGFDSPTVSTAHTNGASTVTHLGVVGRGVKRVLMSTGTAESSPLKKPPLDPSSDKQDGNAS